MRCSPLAASLGPPHDTRTRVHKAQYPPPPCTPALVQVHDGQVWAAALSDVLIGVQPHQQEVPLGLGSLQGEGGGRD